MSKTKNFTAREFEEESNGFESELKNVFEGNGKTWNEFLKPVVNVAAPFLGMAVSAITKLPKIGQATTIISKSISEGKF